MSHLRKGEAYRPLPDSAAEIMITWLKLQACKLSSAALAEVAGVPNKQVLSILGPAVKAGMIGKCTDEKGLLSWWYAGEPQAPTADDDAAAAEAFARMVQRKVVATEVPPLARRGGVPAPNSVFDLGRYIHDCQA